MSDETYEGWAVIEIMGHRRIAGRCSPVRMFGADMLRVDVPRPSSAMSGGSPSPWATQYYGGSSIYCLTPVSEATGRSLATVLGFSEPVHEWELPRQAPALPPGGSQEADRCNECGALEDADGVTRHLARAATVEDERCRTCGELHGDCECEFVPEAAAARSPEDVVPIRPPLCDCQHTEAEHHLGKACAVTGCECRAFDQEIAF